MRRPTVLLVLACGLLLSQKTVFAEEGIEIDASDTENAEALEEELGPVVERTHYWFNDVTAESQWAKPEYEYTDPNSGDVYYMDPETKETSWDKPDSLKWNEVEDTDGKGTYYHNEGTGVSQWEKPTMLAWRLLSVEEGDLPDKDAHEEL